MEILNNDVIIQITTFCELKEIHNILSTKKQNYNIIKSRLQKISKNVHPHPFPASQSNLESLCVHQNLNCVSSPTRSNAIFLVRQSQFLPSM